MTRREELNRKLAQARRLALEPTDPLTRERLAQLIEELEFQLQDHHGWQPHPALAPRRIRRQGMAPFGSP
jgi:hypothetical protein